MIVEEEEKKTEPTPSPEKKPKRNKENVKTQKNFPKVKLEQNGRSSNKSLRSVHSQDEDIMKRGNFSPNDCEVHHSPLKIQF